MQSKCSQEKGSQEQGKQEGYCLNEFKALLAKLEEKNKVPVWAKLTRALLAEGKSVWVCQHCNKVLKENARNLGCGGQEHMGLSYSPF